MSMPAKMFYDKKKAATVAAILLLMILIAGCSPASTPPPAAPPIPPVAPAPTAAKLSEPAIVSTVVRSAVLAFLANDFAAAQKTMLFQSTEQQDAKTARQFAEFSAHLNKRLALEAKSTGQNAATPVVSVSNLRPTDNGGNLADVTIGAGPDLEPLRLTLKAAPRNGTWLVDHAFFMLALVDALDE
jgi:hypothetical protein